MSDLKGLLSDLGGLTSVILRHMPSSIAASSYPSTFENRAQEYAMPTYFMVENFETNSGFSGSTTTLHDLILTLRKLHSLTKGLSISDRRSLLAMSFVNQVENFTALDDFQRNVEKFLLGAEKMKKHHDLPCASRNRNWKACGAARICRQIWAEEEIAKSGDQWKKFTQTRQKQVADAETLIIEFKLSFAPKSQKADAPAVFGKFLEDVMNALGIYSVDGISHVSAASALNSLKSLDREISAHG
ncbi:hypothetical protein [Roseovarius aestuarii]|uniref:Uncharacterized protein n=1 Tax=Roseovarius aestuarii TaxID=475083 RepID=A0A1X7BVQ8_9RHOB|nr:hypothetical protein [Roseovarius aestuarii]SMC13741.1 hypothetical protein ROA7745_03600 [Roseovarius aestuarii]